MHEELELSFVFGPAFADIPAYRVSGHKFICEFVAGARPVSASCSVGSLPCTTELEITRREHDPIVKPFAL